MVNEFVPKGEDMNKILLIFTAGIVTSLASNSDIYSFRMWFRNVSNHNKEVVAIDKEGDVCARVPVDAFLDKQYIYLDYGAEGFRCQATLSGLEIHDKQTGKVEFVRWPDIVSNPVLILK